jgi:TalC/MipB family fructose-6-phosphate aldolase
MELYLDSVDFKEVEQAMALGIISGLTTTPTFMHRHGITDIDAAIVKLSNMVPVLQIEALGDSPDEILKEAERQLDLGLNPENTVFKIPVSNIGIKACKVLRDKGLKVNVHLVYTVTQAYMAMEAGATYVCPLAGRMQDHNIDAISVFDQILTVKDQYGYPSKIMFSSVRHTEHVRNALMLGVDTVTAPWSVIKKLNDNHLTTIGTDQFIEHTKLMTVKVKEVMPEFNPTVSIDTQVLDALVTMTENGFGAVTVISSDGTLAGVFTDGDLRRNLKEKGNSLLQMKMGDFSYKTPFSISSSALLYEAVEKFKQHQIDNLLVLEDNLPIGMLDIQDFVKMGLIG